MKTFNFKKLFAVAFFVLSFGYAFATNPVLNVVSGNKLAFKLENVIEETDLKIKDINGFTLFSEQINKSSEKYNKTFDLSTLPDGSYIVEVEGEYKIVSYKVTKTNEKLSIPNPEMEIVYKPIVVKKGDKVYISKLNLEKTDMFLKIVNRDNDVVYSETLTGKDFLGRIYDFSKTSGEFTISMNYNERSYSKTVSIKK